MMDTDSKALREALEWALSYLPFFESAENRQKLEAARLLLAAAPAGPVGSGASVFAEVVPGRKATNWVESQPPAAVPSNLQARTINAIKRAAAMLPMLADRDPKGRKRIDDFADQLNELRIELESAVRAEAERSGK